MAAFKSCDVVSSRGGTDPIGTRAAWQREPDERRYTRPLAIGLGIKDVADGIEKLVGEVLRLA